MRHLKIHLACVIAISLFLAVGSLQAQKNKTGQIDEQWDLLLSTEAGITCNDDQLLAAEFAGGFFFVAGGNNGGDPNKVYVLNSDGSYFGEFDQWNSENAGWTDMTYDGQYLYTCQGSIISAFDLAGTPVPEMNITVPYSTVESIAYDPESDLFWIMTTGELMIFERGGTMVAYVPTGYMFVTGMAWDDGAPDGPWLWLFCQTANPPTIIRQFDPVSWNLTGVAYTVPMLPGSTAQSSAGLFFTDEYDPELYCIGGITQGTPNDQLFVLEMYPQSTTSNVDVELTYVSGSPVPPGGGNIVFDVWVENLEAQAVDFDAWLESSYEGGTPTTLVQRSFTNYLPGWTINRPGTWYPIPALWAPGNYRMSGRVGIYPDETWDESSFPFDKLGDSDGGEFTPWPVAGALDPFDRIDKGGNVNPEMTELVKVYPNPFNPSITINYQLSEVTHVNLTVYDITGREVATMVDRLEDAGSHEVTFNASHLSSGVYLYELTAGDNIVSGKMVYMK